MIYDLLDPNNRKRKGAGLEIREHGVLGIYVKGLQVWRRRNFYAALYLELVSSERPCKASKR